MTGDDLRISTSTKQASTHLRDTSPRLRDAPSRYARAPLALLVVAVCACAASCARVNSIYRGKPLKGDASVVAVDAKQRFLITTSSATGSERLRKICLEPSPDAFSVFSSAVEGSAKYSDKAAAELKAAISETGATIGVRTETIQLLRDAMYRICELALNGNLDQKDALALHKHYQKSMVTLAAVTALADASRPVQVAIGGKAAITHGTLMADLSRKIEETTKDRDTKKAAFDAATKELSSSQGKVCATLVTETQECKDDASKCAPHQNGKPLCDVVKTGDKTDPEQLKAVRSQKYCQGRTVDPCADWNAKSATVQETSDNLNNANAALSQLTSEFANVKNGDDVSAASMVVPITSAPAQSSPRQIDAVAGVVQTLLAQVYSEDLVDYCLTLIDRRSALQDEERNLSFAPGTEEYQDEIKRFKTLNSDIDRLFAFCDSIASSLKRDHFNNPASK